jgi:hypothetical protein
MPHTRPSGTTTATENERPSSPAKQDQLKTAQAQNQPFIKRVTRILQPAVLRHKYVDFQLKPPDGDLPVLSYLVHAQTSKEKDKEESHNACYQSAQHSQRSTPPATATSRVFRYIQAGPVS